MKPRRRNKVFTTAKGLPPEVFLYLRVGASVRYPVTKREESTVPTEVGFFVCEFV